MAQTSEINLPALAAKVHALLKAERRVKGDCQAELHQEERLQALAEHLYRLLKQDLRLTSQRLGNRQRW